MFKKKRFMLNGSACIKFPLGIIILNFTRACDFSGFFSPKSAH